MVCLERTHVHVSLSVVCWVCVYMCLCVCARIWLPIMFLSTIQPSHPVKAQREWQIVRVHMCASAGGCVCVSPVLPHIWIADHAGGSLGTHSFKPNPLHSLLMITLVVEAYRDSLTYIFQVKQIKILTFEGQAFTVLSLSLSKLTLGVSFHLWQTLMTLMHM